MGHAAEMFTDFTMPQQVNVFDQHDRHAAKHWIVDLNAGMAKSLLCNDAWR
jgi:hypothetical protein